MERFPKHPDEQFYITADFSDELDSSIGEILDQVQSYVVAYDSSNNDASDTVLDSTTLTIEPDNMTIMVQNGQDGESYNIEFHGYTNKGNWYTIIVVMDVRSVLVFKGIHYHETSIEPLPTSYPSVNLQDFIRNLSYALSVFKPDVDFYPAYPETVYFYDTHSDRFRTTITWDVYHQAPLTLGGRSHPGPRSGTREVAPRLRYIEQEINGDTYYIYGQGFQTFIQFDIWALTAHEAETLAHWFQVDFMAHFGRILGARQVQFYERIRDRDLIKINNKLQTRSLVYFVLLEEVTVKPVNVIHKIRTRIQQLNKR